MSLINQMLQDLDARKAAHGVGATLPNDVRPLPKLEPSRLPLVFGVVVAFVFVGGLAFYQWSGKFGVLPFAAPAAVPVVVTPVLSSTPVVVQTPEKEDSHESLPAEQAPAVVPIVQGLDGSLRMDDLLKPKSEKAASAKTVGVAVLSSLPAEKMHVGEHGSATVAEQKMTLQDKSAKPPTIEKTDSVGSPRERAESEYRKAIAAVNQGQVTEALDSLRNALRQDSMHVASRQLLFRLLLEAKRHDEAVQVLQVGLQEQPAQIGWAMSLARMQVERGDFAAAWQTLDYSLPAASNNADYQGFSAHVLQRLGRNKDAVEHYQTATRLSPGDGRWWLGLGLAIEADGRSSEARDAFLRARQSGNLSAELSALVEQKLR